MSRSSDRVFVDTAAWVALAVVRDPLHERAREQWHALNRAGARLSSSAAVVLETFTFLDRRGTRELAITWKNSLADIDRFTIFDLTAATLAAAWPYLSRREYHKLSLVDATSFALMKHHRIRTAFAFDTHFAIGGFRLVG